MDVVLRLMVMRRHFLAPVLLALVAGCGGGTAAPAAGADVPTATLSAAARAVDFRIAFDAWTREEADAIEAQIGECVQASGGIEQGASFDSAPPLVALRYAGPDADGLDACLRRIGGQPQVERSNASPASDATWAATGATNIDVLRYRRLGDRLQLSLNACNATDVQGSAAVVNGAVQVQVTGKLSGYGDLCRQLLTVAAPPGSESLPVVTSDGKPVPSER